MISSRITDKSKLEIQNLKYFLECEAKCDVRIGNEKRLGKKATN
jgi:hypothetical protein